VLWPGMLWSLLPLTIGKMVYAAMFCSRVCLSCGDSATVCSSNVLGLYSTAHHSTARFGATTPTTLQCSSSSINRRTSGSTQHLQGCRLLAAGEGPLLLLLLLVSMLLLLVEVVYGGPAHLSGSSGGISEMMSEVPSKSPTLSSKRTYSTTRDGMAQHSTALHCIPSAQHSSTFTDVQHINCIRSCMQQQVHHVATKALILAHKEGGSSGRAALTIAFAAANSCSSLLGPCSSTACASSAVSKSSSAAAQSSSSAQQQGMSGWQQQRKLR
jgi:hypothetical protein